LDSLILFELIFLVFIISAAIWDSKTERIPDWLTFFSTMILSLWRLNFPDSDPLLLIIDWSLPTLSFLVVYHISKNNLGMGDVKLVGVYGIVLGWKLTFFALLWGNIFALTYGLLLKIRNQRQDGMPLAPFFLIGALLTKFSVTP